MHRHALTITRIHDVPIRVHWSALLLALCLLLAPRLPLPGLSATPPLLFSAVVAVLLLASLLVHEFAHLLVARWCGVPVRTITFFVFGAVTEYDELQQSPLALLLIAISGPLVSLGLAVLCGAVWWLSAATLLHALVFILMLANLALALFQLLPGYLLDGGTMLRAVLLLLSGEPLPSAYRTAQMSRGAGWVLVASGFVYGVMTEDFVGGLLLTIIGVFLIYTAANGYQQILQLYTLHGVLVSALMARHYRAVQPDLRLDRFVGTYLLGQMDQAYPVLAGIDGEPPQALLGMISARNLRRFRLEHWAGTDVQHAMTPLERLHRLAPDTPLSEAFRTMLDYDLETLPVMSDRQLLGLVRRQDVLHYMEKQSAHLRQNRL